MISRVRSYKYCSFKGSWVVISGVISYKYGSFKGLGLRVDVLLFNDSRGFRVYTVKGLRFRV